MKRAQAQRGLSVVDLLVGLAVGLVIVAAGLLLFSQHLRENRNLLLQARLMQDLRSVTDLMARDLRRAGYWADAVSGVASPELAGLPNPFTEITRDPGATQTFQYRYDAPSDGAGTNTRQFGYRLRDGVIEMQIGQGGWQAMTDASSLRITALSITPRTQELSLADACRRPCPSPDATCPPRQQRRSLSLSISAQATADASLRRSTGMQIHLRNDALTGACPT